MKPYIFSQIRHSDPKAQKQLRSLLGKSGLPTDQPADFTLGIYDQHYNLIATGSIFQNQLHSLTVDLPYRENGLLCQIVSYLHELRFKTGHLDLCLTVHQELVPIFRSLGFHKIKHTNENNIYMGNHHALKNHKKMCQN